MTAHNAKARMRQLEAAQPSSDRLRHAAAELARAIDALAAAPEDSTRSLAASIYPPRAEAAGDALQRFRDIALCKQGDDPFGK